MTDRLDEEFEPNRNDLAIQRMARLALMFMNASGPISMSKLLKTIYLDEYDEPTVEDRHAAYISFTRDIKALANCGIYLKNVSTNNKNNESLWQVDPDKSWAKPTQLSLKDALVLQALCTPIAQDPNFPWQKELREALLRITRSFDAAPALVSWVCAAHESSAFTEVRRAFDLNRAVRVNYTNRAGQTKDHTLFPLGIFPQLGATYLVAADLQTSLPEEAYAPLPSQQAKLAAADKNPNLAPLSLQGQPIKTFLASSIHSAEVLVQRYLMPEDFELESYIAQIRHPYQIGTTKQRAVFVVIPGFEQSAAQELDNQMEVWENAGHTYLSVSYANEHILALWAKNSGCIPLSPDSLVEHWNQLLETTLAKKES